jgi:hypothetical protein
MEIYNCEDNYFSWHDFVRWFTNGCKSKKYLKLTNDLNKYTISKYPDGRCIAIHKDRIDDIISGIWFYIGSHEIILLPYINYYN